MPDLIFGVAETSRNCPDGNPLLVPVMGSQLLVVDCNCAPVKVVIVVGEEGFARRVVLDVVNGIVDRPGYGKGEGSWGRAG